MRSRRMRPYWPEEQHLQPMDERTQMILVVIVGTVLVLAMVGMIGLLLVVNSNRRVRYSAQLAELQQQQERAVMEAEREATQHALRDIGSELHDNVGQLLSVAQLGLNTLLDEGLADLRLTDARDAVEQGAEEVRRLGHDLNAELWKHRSLVDAISAEAERLERVARVKVRLQVDGGATVLEPANSIVLYRVFQVIITNALKHSGADEIDITLVTAPRFKITVVDNGKGFDPQQVKAHAGLANLYKRCALIGYNASCTTTVGGGCIWHLQPLPEHAP